MKRGRLNTLMMDPGRTQKKAHQRMAIIGFATSAAFFALATAALAASEQFVPKLGIPIPNVKLELSASGTPFIGQYIGGVYEFLTGIASILAGVMLVVGGAQYVTGQVAEGKKRIENAVAGLFLTLAAYTILNTVSFNLTAFKPLQIRSVEGQRFEMAKVGGVGFAGQESLDKDASATPIDQPAPPASDPVATAPIIEVIDMPGEEEVEVEEESYSPFGARTVADANASGGPLGALVKTVQARVRPATKSGGAVGKEGDSVTGDLVNLYAADDEGTPREGNDYGVVVRGDTPRERMFSVCRDEIAVDRRGGDSWDEAMRLARAITAVWINEAFGGGAVYVRGNYSQPAGSADFPFLAEELSGGKGKCLGENAGGLSTIQGKVALCREKQDQGACSSAKPALNSAYNTCWAGPVHREGKVGGDCKSFVEQLLECALDGVPNLATGIGDVAFVNGGSTGSGIDPGPWQKSVATLGGPQPFDVLKFGTGCGHVVMYIGGLGLTSASTGKEIHWIEMGGGGVADLGPGRRNLGAGGLAAKPHVNGIESLGITVHFDPTISAFAKTTCAASRLPKDKRQIKIISTKKHVTWSSGVASVSPGQALPDAQ